LCVKVAASQRGRRDLQRPRRQFRPATRLRGRTRAKVRLDVATAVLVALLLFVAVDGLARAGLVPFGRIMPRHGAQKPRTWRAAVGATVMGLIEACEAEAGAMPYSGCRWGPAITLDA
jgi:hypothetical protein